jgi:hypothetical protein
VPEFRARIFKRLWSTGIDSKERIPPAYVAWRAGTITLFLLGPSPQRLIKNSSSDPGSAPQGGVPSEKQAMKKRTEAMKMNDYDYVTEKDKIKKRVAAATKLLKMFPS